MSQRIKALEQRVGQEAGIRLLRLPAQVAMLEAEAIAEMGGGGSVDRPRIAVAVNADSMSTWFTAVWWVSYLVCWSTAELRIKTIRRGCWVRVRSWEQSLQNVQRYREAACSHLA